MCAALYECIILLFCRNAIYNHIFDYFYCLGICINQSDALGENEILSKRKKWILIVTCVAIFGNVCIWFLLKGSSFWTLGLRALHHFFPFIPVISKLPIAASLGMGYYTAQVISYIVDCYWGGTSGKFIKNPLKLFLYVTFFPQLIVGPISRYTQMECLYERHCFSYDNICFGSQRILWGFFKKLVLSERIGIMTAAIWGEPAVYSGFWPWIALLIYPLQIYTDFSGCMDIVLGTAELFDIRLPENFKNPFFAKTCQEFWQRWHITLGAWARDYIYYPVLKSQPLQALGKWGKRHFSKRTAKLIPWSIGMGVLWFVMGFWHGSVQYIIGVSFWFWFLLVLGEIFAPHLKKLSHVLKINTASFSWRLFQRLRTYILFSFGCVFFSASSFKDAMNHYRVLWYSVSKLNPWIFLDGSIFNMGIQVRDIHILIVGVLFLLLVGILRDRYGYARVWMKQQILPFRWMIWLGLLALVLVFGMYGTVYDTSDFIYQNF